MSIVLIDASADSLTVSWPDPMITNQKTTSKPTSYHLQYRHNCNHDETVDDSAYETLSKSLHTTLVRKKNLTDPEQNGFIFRVRKSNSGESDDEYYNNNYEWITHTEPFYLLTKEQSSQRMVDPPSVTYGGTNASLRISWKAPVDSTTTGLTYEIQMRENMGGVPWTTIATTHTSTDVRKKNLTSIYGYQFRIRPNYARMSTDDTNTTGAASTTTTVPFSPPSEPVIALSYSTNCGGLQRLFSSLTNQTVLSNPHLNNNSRNKNNNKLSPIAVPVAEALGGKEFILLYASAHWCGPCRQYTPKLITWYQQQVASVASTTGDKNESTIEIVFVSADHDAASFQSYYSSMPWSAIDYEDATREQLMSYIRVTGIPRLAVLDGRTGAIIEDNAVSKPLDIQRWRKLVSK